MKPKIAHGFLLILMLVLGSFSLHAQSNTSQEIGSMNEIISSLRETLSSDEARKTFDVAADKFNQESTKYFEMEKVLAEELPPGVNPKQLEKIDGVLKGKYGFDTYSVTLQFEKVQRIFKYELMSVVYRDYDKAFYKGNGVFESSKEPVSERIAKLKAYISAYKISLDKQRIRIGTVRKSISKQAKFYAGGYSTDEIDNKKDINTELPKFNILNYYLHQDILKAVFVEYQDQDNRLEKKNMEDAEKFLGEVDPKAVTAEQEKVIKYLELTLKIKDAYDNNIKAEDAPNKRSAKFYKVLNGAKKLGNTVWGGMSNMTGSALNVYLAMTIKDFLYVAAVKAGLGDQLPEDAEKMYRNVSYGEFLDQVVSRYSSLDTHKVFGAFVLADMGGKIIINGLVDSFTWLCKKTFYRGGAGFYFQGTMRLVKGVGAYVIPLAIAERISSYYGLKLQLSDELGSSDPEINKLAQDVIDANFPSYEYEVRRSLSFALSFGLSHMIFTTLEKAILFKPEYAKYREMSEITRKYREEKCLELRSDIESLLWKLGKKNRPNRLMTTMGKFKRWSRTYLASSPKVALNFFTAEILEDRLVTKIMFSKHEREDRQKEADQSFETLLSKKIDNLVEDMLDSDSTRESLERIYSKHDDSKLIVDLVDYFRGKQPSVLVCLKLRDEQNDSGRDNAKDCLLALLKEGDPYNYEWWDALSQSSDPAVKSKALDEKQKIVNDSGYLAYLKEQYKGQKDAALEEIEYQERNIDRTVSKTSLSVTEEELKEELKSNKKMVTAIDPVEDAKKTQAYYQVKTAYELLMFDLENSKYTSATAQLKEFLDRKNTLNVLNGGARTPTAVTSNAYTKLSGVIQDVYASTGSCEAVRKSIENLFYDAYPEILENVSMSPLLDDDTIPEMDFKTTFLYTMASDLMASAEMLCKDAGNEKTLKLLDEIQFNILFSRSKKYSDLVYRMVAQTIQNIKAE
jgi:hypothetical protein